ncbi:substrate-binding periplasmic protein [Vibrio neptunius]|uniref:substrate-binding periplasmic protein n=1 Tax=Vibrio neptunius TaxID=170651 RepID=UPI001C5CBFF8|nr:transporter substrate-binding domain-containing protein [Vibrio neptunius]QXX08806.1 transporter substrate-binding domain-containing protein [Vibrio neptunius]
MKWIVTVLFVLVPAYSLAQDIQEIELVCDEWPSYTNSDGTGVYWDIVKRVYEPLGIKVNTQTVPWKRAQLSVSSKQKDAYVGDYFDASKDKKDYLYPKEHLSIEESVVVVFKNDYNSEWQSRGTAMLSDKRVAWIRGYGFENNVLKGIDIQLKEVKGIDQAILMLSSDRVDAVVDYQSNIVKALSSDIDNYTLLVLEEGQKLFVVFSNTPKSAYLVDMFDKKIKEMREKGEIDAIYAKYGIAPPSN